LPCCSHQLFLLSMWLSQGQKHNNNSNSNNNKFPAELLCKQTAKTESCLWRALKAVVTAANS
jgi:hypothetical protein